ncbi:MAG: hypothetical protein VKJ64_07390 [Leptolyngbyaceae bacterium]|nr:hypothetical protein [Leptolyngbyaceae bacterium]
MVLGVVKVAIAHPTFTTRDKTIALSKQILIIKRVEGGYRET